jgi:hypothetical protein
MQIFSFGIFITRQNKHNIGKDGNDDNNDISDEYLNIFYVK